MFEFLSSPFGLVAVGLGVLAVAVLALCLWITTLDRRMRGMADGLEAERRKVAEMQMVIGRRSNAARSYGGRGRAAAPAPAPAAAPASVAPAAAVSSATVPAASQSAYAAPPAHRAQASRQASTPGAGWTPSSIPMPASAEVDAWVQGGAAGQQPFIMPDRKMSRKARREAERAFAARAAAELEARQARRAQEAASVQQAAAQPGSRAYGNPAARAGYAAPRAAGQPMRAGAQPGRPVAPAARAAAQPAGVPAQAQGFAPVQSAYRGAADPRGRHVR